MRSAFFGLLLIDTPPLTLGQAFIFTLTCGMNNDVFFWLVTSFSLFLPPFSGIFTFPLKMVLKTRHKMIARVRLMSSSGDEPLMDVTKSQGSMSPPPPPTVKYPTRIPATHTHQPFSTQSPSSAC